MPGGNACLLDSNILLRLSKGIGDGRLRGIGDLRKHIHHLGSHCRLNPSRKVYILRKT